MTDPHRVVLLAGGFGGARMAHGFALLGEKVEVELTVIGNTGDDLELHGLHISPDLDTVMYTLAGLSNDETGWGVRDETWSAAEMLEHYGEPTWFRLGDRDLATHVVRSARLRAGERLTDVTRYLSRSLGVKAEILPMSDDPVRTKVRTDAGWLDFQDYFVQRGHRDEVHEIRFDGVDSARPTSEVTHAIEEATVIVIAPSNPYVSVAPILAVPGVLDALRESAALKIAISPIVGGQALRGPAAQMMRSLGGTPSAVGTAAFFSERYPGLIDIIAIDKSDSDANAEITRMGIQAQVAEIVIADHEKRLLLAEKAVSWAGTGSRD
jgi:LPPG:FO 2-phospho-L-lactate transferase